MKALILGIVAACSAPAATAPPPPIAPPAAPPTVAPAIASAADPTPPAFRLPGDVVPVRIKLDLTIVPDQPSAHGEITIAAKLVRPTRVVWLNAHGLTIEKATIAGAAARIVPGGDQFVGLAADRELPASFDIEVGYTAPIDHDKSIGIYAAAEGGKTFAYTFFEPIDARRAFPCFDEPGFKVPWQLTLHVKRDQLARGNTAVVQETDEGRDMKKVELAETVPLPSYLIAFVVGPFDDVDDGVAGRAHTPIHFIVPPGHRDELAFAKLITPKVVAALETYFAMDYPFGKLDVAVVPRYWGTMEHPGIVAMGQPLTLIRPAEQTREREERYTNILAHELGHYWFGDLVTMAWFDDTWLNESFGQWLDLITTDAVMPAWHVLDERVPMATWGMRADETLAAQPIRLPVTTSAALEAAFDGQLTYLKGATVLRQFEAFVGRAPWQAFIRGYIHRHRFGSATGPELFAELREAFGAPTAEAFEHDFTRPGVGLVHLHADCQAHQLVLDPIVRALPAGVVEDAGDQRTFSVPVCARFGDAHHADRACTLGAPIAVAYCPTWIVPNAGATGYYRSRMDLAMATALLDPHSALAHQAKPTSAERGMITADLAAMVKRGELPIDQALPLVAKLVRDPDPRLAREADFVNLHTGGLPDDLYAAVQRWQIATFAPLAHSLGWHRAKGDSDDREKLRSTALAHVVYFDPASRAQAEKLADQWMADRGALPDDLVDLALSAAAFKGDAARYERYLAAAKATHDGNERRRWLAALGGFSDPALAARARELVLGHDFDTRDAIGILEGQLSRRELRDGALQWVQAHLDELIARQRDDENSWTFGQLAGVFCDAAHRDAVAALLAPRADKISGARVAMTRGLEQTSQCIAEVAREMPALQHFFMKRQ
ncbi:MAG: M1 family metallopeptidase [Kofleriaceae bacterium]